MNLMDFRMFLLIGLLLINFVSAVMKFDPLDDCDFHAKLTSQNVTLYNPQWPAAYKPGLMCRWTYDCPIWHSCILQCRELGLPQTTGCYMDKLLVSQTGDPFFSNAEIYCGRDVINYKSVGTRIVIALITHPLSPGGRFICTLKTELWSQQFGVARNRTVTTPRKRNKKPQRKKSKSKDKNIGLASAPQKYLANLPKVSRIEHETHKINKILFHRNRTKIDHGEYIHEKLQHGVFLNKILHESKHKSVKSKHGKHQHTKSRQRTQKQTTRQTEKPTTETNNDTCEQSELNNDTVEQTDSRKETHKQKDSSSETNKQTESQNQTLKDTKMQQEDLSCTEEEVEPQINHKEIQQHKRFTKVKSVKVIDPLYEDKPNELNTKKPHRIHNQEKSQYKIYKSPELHNELVPGVDIPDAGYKKVRPTYRDPELAESMNVDAKLQNLDLYQPDTQQIKTRKLYTELPYKEYKATTPVKARHDIAHTPSSEVKRLEDQLRNFIVKSSKTTKEPPKRATIIFKYTKKVVKVVRTVKRRRRTAKKRTGGRYA